MSALILRRLRALALNQLQLDDTHGLFAQSCHCTVLTFRKWVEPFPASGEECRVARGKALHLMLLTCTLKHILHIYETNKHKPKKQNPE